MFSFLNRCIKIQHLCIKFTRRLNYKLKMNSAYFRHVNGETSFQVSFLLVIQDSKLNKQFNFNRNISENCGDFLNRVAANVEKVVLKKNKKKKLEATEILPTVAVNLLCNGNKTDSNYPCSNIFSSSEKFSLQILDQLLPIEINVPWIDAIALPKSVMAGFMVYPCKFDTFFVNRSCCNWEWYRSSVNNGKWELCGNTEIYLTTSDDIGKYLRLVCEPVSDCGRIGPKVEAITSNIVDAGPGALPCESRQVYTQTKMTDNGFRVISYNILADLYVDSEYSRTILFGYCPTYALEHSYRKQLLLKELLGYNADIICLQEVDSKLFRHDLTDVLNLHRMTGIFSQKGETVNEGTAIFYNKSKFSVEKNIRIILGEVLPKLPLFSNIWDVINKKENLSKRVTERSTTLQVILLRSLLQSKKLVLVANVHLYFHPDADHIRLLQGVLITTYLESTLRELKIEFPEDEISLVWCGDFNSVPECGIFQLLVTQGYVPADHPDWRSNLEESIENLSYETKLRMDSAYGSPKFTNYTVGFKACLDYIFYEKNNLEVEQTVPLPEEEELSLNLGIPSIFFPSDHVALVADLRWKN